MTSSDLLPGIQEIFRDVLDQPDLVITPRSNATTVEDWDSMAHVNLITAIAHHYKVKFALGEIQDLKDVGDLTELLAQKLNAQAR